MGVQGSDSSHLSSGISMKHAKRLACMQTGLVMDRAAGRRKQVFQARCDGIMGGGQWAVGRAAADSGRQAAGGGRPSGRPWQQSRRAW